MFTVFLCHFLLKGQSQTYTDTSMVMQSVQYAVCLHVFAMYAETFREVRKTSIFKFGG